MEMSVYIVDLHRNQLAVSRRLWFALIKFDPIRAFTHTIYLKTSKDFKFVEKLELLTPNDVIVDEKQQIVRVKGKEYGLDHIRLQLVMNVLSSLALDITPRSFKQIVDALINSDTYYLFGCKLTPFPFIIARSYLPYAIVVAPTIFRD